MIAQACELVFDEIISLFNGSIYCYYIVKLGII